MQGLAQHLAEMGPVQHECRGTSATLECS